MHILAIVLVCLEENKFTRSYKEYKISLTTKMPKNGQKQRSHSSRAVANPEHHSLVGVTCAGRKAQHNAICCPRLILTFHNQTPQCRRCGPDLEPMVLRYEFTMVLCSTIGEGAAFVKRCSLGFKFCVLNLGKTAPFLLCQVYHYFSQFLG